MTCDVLCAAPIAAQKHKQTAIVHLRTPRRCITAPLRLRFVNCSADRKVLLRRSQYLTPLHSIHRLLRNPGTTEMIEVVKDGEGCGGGNDARGDERHGYVRLKRANHDVQGNQEHDDRSGQQHHAVGKRFAKRNYRFLLFNSKASHPRYYRFRMGLEEYKRKRKFDKTPEPAGTVKEGRGNSFVIQKHHATRLHYDFRLEMGGVLRSWAIPKGPSFNPAEKRLAVETEDHPIDYGEFEGTIPAGNYGAGKVIIWDNGTYEMVDPDTPEKGWKKGKLHFVLKGKKLKGEWVLVRGSREPRQWIFFKVRDQYASSDIDITKERPESVVSGSLVDEIGEQSPSRQWVTPIERELEKYGMKNPGRAPIPKNIQPMLATLSEKPFRNDDWFFELKLDGIRAIAVKNGTRLDMRTRNARSLADRFPTLAQAFKELPVDTAVLDGEIVALDEKGHSHFHLIQPRIHLSRAKDIAMADEQIPVYFYAFDLLYLNGYNLMKFPLIERKAVLGQLIPNNDGWI